MAHLHEMRDMDTHFIIDPASRAITNAQSAKNKLMQYDHNSEIFTFEIPKEIDGHDMALCDKIEIHYLNIDAKTRETQKDLYTVQDAALSEDGETVTFSWLISGNATKYAGYLNFLIRFSCLENGQCVYVWNTDIYSGITISSGICNDDELVQTFPDVLEQWKEDLLASGEIGSGGTILPTIGENGNWYLGDTDTGKPSRGETGPAGADGQPGADGAPGPVGATPNIQIGDVETLPAGSDATASMSGTAENPLLNLGIPKGADGTNGKTAYQYAQDGGYTGTEAEFAAKLAEELPDKLPNPNALTFTGAITGSYDGSATMNVEIPNGGLTVINTAAVGQTVRITEVDGNGQPAAWEAVDFTSGDVWELLYETTLTENAETFSQGIPACSKVKMVIIPVSNVNGWKRIIINDTSYPTLNSGISANQAYFVSIDTLLPPYITASAGVYARPELNGINSGNSYSSYSNSKIGDSITMSGCGTAEMLVTGAIIKIWGVRK